MNDEKYVFIQDVREKKNIARSAKHVRTHNGAGGSVKFPSDFLSNKERKAMNGECKSYRLNEPMSWNEFKALPDDLKKSYILALRKKFNVPDKYIAEMMGISTTQVCKTINKLGLQTGSASGSKKKSWDGTEWHRWVTGDDVEPETSAICDVEAIKSEEAPVVNNAIFISPEKDPTKVPSYAMSATTITFDPLPIYMSVPTRGNMSFDGRIENILPTIAMMLNNKNVHIDISWEVEEDV